MPCASKLFIVGVDSMLAAMCAVLVVGVVVSDVETVLGMDRDEHEVAVFCSAKLLNLKRSVPLLLLVSTSNSLRNSLMVISSLLLDA